MKKWITLELIFIEIPLTILYLFGLFDILVLLNLVPGFMKSIEYFMTSNNDCNIVVITALPLGVIFLFTSTILVVNTTRRIKTFFNKNN